MTFSEEKIHILAYAENAENTVIRSKCLQMFSCEMYGTAVEVGVCMINSHVLVFFFGFGKAK